MMIWLLSEFDVLAVSIGGAAHPVATKATTIQVQRSSAWMAVYSDTEALMRRSINGCFLNREVARNRIGSALSIGNNLNQAGCASGAVLLEPILKGYFNSALRTKEI
jgi:hypothetical protein